MFNDQLIRDLTGDMKEIINNHLLIEKNTIIFRKDETGASLKEFLTNENISAMIFDSKKAVIRSYGLFAFTDKQSPPRLTDIISTVYTSQTAKQIQAKWNNQDLKIIIVPLRSNRAMVGSLMIGKSISDLIGLRQTMIVVFLVLGLLGLGGSFIIGYGLAQKTLNPLIGLAHLVENIDLDKLDKNLSVDGHPQDELALLTTRFNEMMKRLQDMTLRQKQFIANASHELKTPLTRAITSLEILEVTPNLKPEINLIKDDLFHINTLLDKLLFLTKIKKDDQFFNKSHSVFLNFIFAKLRKQFQKQAEEKQIALEMSYPEIIITKLPDEYLEIILSNLISNAIKYSRSATPITIKVSKSTSNTVVTIQNQGIGMTPEEIKHIFERFYRGKAAGHKQEGYGIGLSIVKQICDLYDLKVTVDSQVGKETTIKLVL